MKKLMTCLALGTFATLLGVASAPTALAQTDRENSTFTVAEPLDVGSFTLQPGTYLIRVVTLESNRNMIQVTNEDQTKVFASVLATPHRISAGEQIPTTRYTYYATAPGHHKAIRTWFARDAAVGHDIVYPKQRALELAAEAKAPVIAIPDDAKEADYKTASLTIVTPEQESKPYEQPAVVLVQKSPAPAPPVVVAKARPVKKLPATASDVPLFALLGVVSLGAGVGLRTFANRAS